MKRFLSIMLCVLLSCLILCACGKKDGKASDKPLGTTASQSETEASSEAPVTETETTTEEKPTGTLPHGTDGVVETFDYKAEYLEIIEVYERDFGTIPEGESFFLGSGLYYANLVDFDKNGTPELVLGHINVGTEYEYFEMKYNIYAVVDEKVTPIESGDLYKTGGPDPSVYICYTEDLAYFVTGTSQAFTVNNYKTFNGKEFETAFSFELSGYAEDGAVGCKVNGEDVSYSEYLTAVEELDKSIVKSDNFFLCWDRNETVERLEATKDALRG